MDTEIIETKKERAKTKTFYIDDETWMKFRHLCLDQKQSATGVLNKLIVDFIESKNG